MEFETNFIGKDILFAKSLPRLNKVTKFYSLVKIFMNCCT